MARIDGQEFKRRIAADPAPYAVPGWELVDDGCTLYYHDGGDRTLYCGVNWVEEPGDEDGLNRVQLEWVSDAEQLDVQRPIFDGSADGWFKLVRWALARFDIKPSVF